jgi:transaldolase
VKIFIDTANVEHIREMNSYGIVDGVTTNPTLIAKEGREFADVVKEICEIVDGPVSAEVVSEKAEDMIPEAEELCKIHKNVIIKIPMTAEGLKATKICREKGIKTNVTLVFSPNQALLAAKAGATYLSPFVGRVDDISHFGMDIIDQILGIYNNYDIDTQVIVASIRNPLHVLEAAMMGAHVSTIPYDVLSRMIKHPLTDIGIEKFLADYAKIPGAK